MASVDVVLPVGSSVRHLERWGRSCLFPSRTAALDAQLLLGYVLDRNRAWVLAHCDEHVTLEDTRRYRSLVEERAGGVPVAYLRGYAEWFGVRLHVDASVLIPRPETELLVEEAARVAQDMGAATAADVGTGSGGIAIGLALSVRALHIVATDVSPDALSVASRNAASLDLGHRIEFAQGSLLSALGSEPDLVVANLPYISTNGMTELDADVLHEPRLALHGGDTGLELYEALLRQRRDRGWRTPVVLEIDPLQVSALAEVVRSTGGDSTRTVLDYAGQERIVVIGG